MRPVSFVSSIAFCASFSAFFGIAGCAQPGGAGDPGEGLDEDIGVSAQAQIIAGDCLGGASSAGVCQPIQIAGGQQRPQWVAVDGTRAYWSGSTFYQVNATSVLGGPVETLASGSNAPGPVGVAVGAGYVVYVTTNGTVARVAPGSSSAAPVILATGQGQLVSVVTDGYFAYFTDYSGGRVARVKLRPQAGDSVEVLATGQTNPWGLALSGDHLYWTNAAAGSPSADNGSVSRVNVATGEIDCLAAADTARAVAVSGGFVYWTDSYRGTVNRMSAADLSGCGAPHVTAIVTGQSSPIGLAVDESRLYWANYGGGTVARSNLDGSAAETIAADQRHPLTLAQDASAIYWVNDEWDTTVCASPPCGSVMKLPK